MRAIYKARGLNSNSTAARTFHIQSTKREENFFSRIEPPAERADLALVRHVRIESRITQVILNYQEVLPEWYAQSYLLSGFPNTESVMVHNLIVGIGRFETFNDTRVRLPPSNVIIRLSSSSPMHVTSLLFSR